MQEVTATGCSSIRKWPIREKGLVEISIDAVGHYFEPGNLLLYCFKSGKTTFDAKEVRGKWQEADRYFGQ